MSMQRKKIVWNSGETHVSKRLRLMPHITNCEVPKEFYADYYANLLPGSLWRVAVPLMKDLAYPDITFDQPPFPYLVRSLHNMESGISANTLALYIGEVRVDEITQLNRAVSVIRRCFLIDGRRYLTRDINNFVPINNLGASNVI